MLYKIYIIIATILHLNKIENVHMSFYNCVPFVVQCIQRNVVEEMLHRTLMVKRLEGQIFQVVDCD